MKRIVFLIAVFSVLFPVSAQKRVSLDLDLGFMFGIYESAGDYASGITRKDAAMGGFSARASVMYHFSDVIWAGAGLGAERYVKPDHNTFPYFLTIRVQPKSFRSFFLFSNLGYSFQGEDSVKGALWDVGAGYRIKLGRKLGLNLKLSANIKNLRYDSWNMGTRYSAFFQTGLEF